MVSSTIATVSSKEFSPSLLPTNTTPSTYRSSPCSLHPKHVRRMALQSAFAFHKDHHGLRSFQSSVEQQFSSNFQARASFGRFSGAVHGNNSRKSLPRHKRSEKALEHNNKDHGNLQSKESADEPSVKGSNGRIFCDDAPYNEESGCSLYDDTSDDVEVCSEEPVSATYYLYDSIHGDFWVNDPYYQEFEASGNEMGILTGDSLETPNKCPKSSQGYVEGNGKIRNETTLTDKTVNILDIRSTPTQDYGVVSSSCGETYISSQDLSSTYLDDFTNVLERGQVSSVDDSEQQDKEGREVVRQVGGAKRPSLSLGSLQNVVNSLSESMKGSGNEDAGGMGLEYRCLTEGNATDLDNTTHMSSLKTNSPTKASAASITFMENSGVSESQVLNAIGQVVDQVTELLPDSMKEQVVSVVDQVENLPTQVLQVGQDVVDQVEKLEQVMSKVVDQMTEVLADPIVEQVGQVAEQMSQTAEQIVEHVSTQVVEPISTTASQLVSFLSNDDDDVESDDEFEAYRSIDIPEFKGRQGLDNFTVLQEQQNIISIIYDFYIFMLKRSLFEFMLGMFAAPILLSVIFTILYLPEFNGLVVDVNVDSDADVKGGLAGLQLSWQTVFQVFMFSVSLSTGLQPVLVPLSPYTLVVANLNALVAQLIFVFLSGAVFARLSQPSQPVKFSKVAIICPPPSNRRHRKEVYYNALLTRYALVGPQPCELVDVKLDLTYQYNTVTRSGTYFRTSQSLKLVRPEIAFLNHGMLVRHIIDETSPLYERTRGMLEKEDAVFSLSVMGLERSSMQSIFHVQDYCVYDKDIVWNAEFVDMILISQKNRRVVDHSLLSTWRPVVPK